MAPSARSVAPRLAAALLLAPLAACGHDDAASDTFAWSQPVSPGGWVRVRNLNGSVRVARGAGPSVRISATKRYKGKRPEAVRFMTATDGGGATVCAVWGSSGRCSASGYSGGKQGGRSFLRDLLFRRSSVAVDFLVALPPGVRLDASTVNGKLTIADAAGEVKARSVNGSIVLDARGGPVDASTVNGSVLARVADLAPGAGVKLGSVNGSVTAMVPPSMDGDLDLQTTNGRVSSELPVPGQQASRRALRGTLGAGGRSLSLHTVNGSVRLERATDPAAPATALISGTH
jgi:hypothetical protein